MSKTFAYGHFLAADYKALLAFTYDTTTISNIVPTKKMKLSATKDNDGFFLSGGDKDVCNNVVRKPA
jgi:hypothetical protein